MLDELRDERSVSVSASYDLLLESLRDGRGARTPCAVYVFVQLGKSKGSHDGCGTRAIARLQPCMQPLFSTPRCTLFFRTRQPKRGASRGARASRVGYSPPSCPILLLWIQLDSCYAPECACHLGGRSRQIPSGHTTSNSRLV